MPLFTGQALGGQWRKWLISAVKDTFTRTNTTTGLGVSSYGNVWSAIRGNWNISNNLANSSDSPTSYPIASVNASKTDLTIKATDVGNGPGVVFWLSDANNWWAVNQTLVTTYTASVYYAGAAASYYPGSSASYYAGYYTVGSSAYYTQGAYHPAVYYNGTDSVYRAAQPAYYFPGAYVPTSYYPGIYSNAYYDPGVSVGSYYNASYNYYAAPYYRAPSYSPAHYTPSYYNPGTYLPPSYTPATSAYFVPPTYPSYTPAYYSPGYYYPGSNSVYVPPSYTAATSPSYTAAVPASYTPASTTYAYSLNLIKSVANSVTTVVSQALGSVASLAIKVVTLGTGITATAYTDKIFTLANGTPISYTASGTKPTLKTGIVVAPTTNGQTSTLSSFSAE